MCRLVECVTDRYQSASSLVALRAAEVVMPTLVSMATMVEAMALLMAYSALVVVMSAVEMAMLKASSAVVEVSLVVSRSGVFANDLCSEVSWP